MKIQTLSIVVGTSACNARCPYCVSRMTGNEIDIPSSDEFNVRNLRKAAEFAKAHHTSTVLITGKGEPTLYPDIITEYLEVLQPFNFPFIELQTNGLNLVYGHEKTLDRLLAGWYDLGLTTIAISVVHWESQINRQIFTPHLDTYPDMFQVARELGAHFDDKGFLTRMTCTMFNGGGGIGSGERLHKFVKKCAEYRIPQASFAPVRAPHNTFDDGTREWVKEHELDCDQLWEIKNYLGYNGTKLMTLIHGGEVYDLEGVSVCLRDCLTLTPNNEELRQLIYFPDGKVYYDWQYKGARLL